MSVKQILKKNKYTKDLYRLLKSIKDEREKRIKFKYHGSFVNRSLNREYLCVVLAGYKEYSYDAVFGRIKSFVTDEIDVCVVTSGLYSETVSNICLENNWSYLSTKENNVSLVQNVAINLHPHAKMIFKLDEDIFITKDYFEKMIRAYEHAKSGVYNARILAPIIPINGYGHVRVLEKVGQIEYYEKNFEDIKYCAGPIRKIESNPDVAKFFWGGGDGIIPSIDKLNELFGEGELDEKPCPIRFSIGAIFFERSLWEEMSYFTVTKGNLGADESQLCTFCVLNSCPILVSENVVVGHLSFGRQNQVMKEYYLEHKEKFLVQSGR